MTVADRPRRRDPLLLWLGHYSLPFLWVFVAVAVISGVTHWGFLTWVTSVTTAVLVVTVLASVRHDARLCERCIAATPLDPQAAVQAWRPVLRLYHRRWLSPAVLAVVLTGLLLPAAYRHPPWWAVTANVTAFVLTGLLWTVAQRHRKLYPWCPWCRWEDGGDYEASPDVPAPTVSRG